MSNTQIHPTALVASSAQLGDNVCIGPFAIVEDQVVIGNHCTLEAYSMIRTGVIMDDHNHIYPQAVIGGLPQDLGFDPNTETRVKIGNHNTFREAVTVSRAAEAGQATEIGSHCYFMNNSHVAHDCKVGDHTIFANNVAIAGFVTVGEKVFIGGGTMVHQFCRIGSLTMIAGTIGVTQDIIPYTLVWETPARHYRLNTIGLRRAGIKGKRYQTISDAFRCLRSNRPIDHLAETPEILHLKDWLAAESKRGTASFLKAKPKSKP